MKSTQIYMAMAHNDFKNYRLYIYIPLGDHKSQILFEFIMCISIQMLIFLLQDRYIYIVHVNVYIVHVNIYIRIYGVRVCK